MEVNFIEPNMTKTDGGPFSPVPTGSRPADDGFEVIPDDYADLPVLLRGFNFITDGTLHVITAAGMERTYPEGLFAQGQIHALRIRRVLDTGTTMTGIWGFI